MPCTCQWYRGICLVWCLHGCGGLSVQECYGGLDLFEGNQGSVTKGRACCGAVFQNMPVRPENPANWEVVGMVEHEDDGSFASCWNSRTKGIGPGDPFDTPQCSLVIDVG